MNLRNKCPWRSICILAISWAQCFCHTASAQDIPGWRFVTDWTGLGDVSPRERWDCVTFADGDGGLWLFGGFGPDVSGSNMYLNDMWKYDPSTSFWTRMEGSDMGGQSGVYGELGIPSPENHPGGRDGLGGWTDADGNFWIYGGYGLADPAAAIPTGILSDLWRYNPDTGEWSWIHGSKQGNQPPVFGAQGESSADYTPGGNNDMPTCIDVSGRFWMFSGLRLRPTPQASRSHHELWSYDPQSGEWTWERGSMTEAQTANYGTQGMPSAAAIPGGRNNGAMWADASGCIWIFGGNGLDGGNFNGFLNDLWKFDPELGQWAWMKGSSDIDRKGVYGTMGQPDAGNYPGSRRTAAFWTGADGLFYLFGGEGYDGAGILGRLNDLWRFDPETNEWTWLHGSPLSGDPGAMATAMHFSSLNLPRARKETLAWVDHSGDFWIYGGIVDVDQSTTMNVADMWRGRLPSNTSVQYDWRMLE